MSLLKHSPTKWGTFDRRAPLAVYLAGTFTVSWLMALTFHLGGGEWGSPASQAMILLYTLPPGLLALVMHAARERGHREASDSMVTLESLGLRPRFGPWWLVAWLLPVAIYVVTNAVALAFPGTSLALSVDDFIAHYPMSGSGAEEFAIEVRRFTESTGLHPTFRVLLTALMAGVTINALRGLGEELGWRGYVHRELRVSFFRESCIVGIVWGVFYLPLVAQGLWYTEHSRWAGAPMAVAWCTAASAVLLFLRNKSGGVFAPAILHGTFEGVAHLPPLVKGLGTFWVGMHGMAGTLALLIALGGLFALDRSKRATGGP